MSKALEKRLTKLEAVVMPPRPFRSIPLVAEDDPDAERLIAEHEHPDLPNPTIIVLSAARRNAEGAIR